jgi:hypothetical protein
MRQGDAGLHGAVQWQTMHVPRTKETEWPRLQ